MDKIKLFLDEDIHATLSEILRKRGFDAIHAQEEPGKGISDSEQFEYAVSNQRCFVSFNIKDTVLLHNAYIQQEKDHWGGGHRFKANSSWRNIASAPHPHATTYEQINQKPDTISITI